MNIFTHTMEKATAYLNMTVHNMGMILFHGIPCTHVPYTIMYHEIPITMDC